MPSEFASQKVALVIGGTRGMGRAISLALAGSGFHVVACGRNSTDVAKLANNAQLQSLSIESCICDATKDDALIELINGTVTEQGRIDVLVFTAGKAFRGSLIDLSAADWDACLGTNLRSPFLAAKHVLPHMIRQAGGSIVFMSSIWAVTTPKKRAAYVVAKSGLPALARAIAIDYGEHGIRANCVAPGYVDNDFLRQSIADIHGHDEVECILAKVRDAHPSLRLVTPEDVAQTVAYLAGPQSAGTNGQTLIVGGGSTVRFSLADMWG